MYPKYRRLLWATPNGGTRNKLEAIKLKKEGVLPGVSDLSLMIPNKDYPGFFIELKVGYNKQTDNQILFQEDVRKMGFRYEVIRTFDQFVEEVTKYMENEIQSMG